MENLTNWYKCYCFVPSVWS